MAQALKKGALVWENGSWFIQTEKGGKIFLPNDLEPLMVKSCGMGMVRFKNQLDQGNRALRRQGAVVLYRFRRHGSRRWIKNWVFCPSGLITHPRIILLTNSRNAEAKRCHCRGLRLLRQAG